MTQALAQVRHHVTQLSSTDETISIAVEDLHTSTLNSSFMRVTCTRACAPAHLLPTTCHISDVAEARTRALNASMSSSSVSVSFILRASELIQSSARRKVPSAVPVIPVVQARCHQGQKLGEVDGAIAISIDLPVF